MDWMPDEGCGPASDLSDRGAGPGRSLRVGLTGMSPVLPWRLPKMTDCHWTFRVGTVLPLLPLYATMMVPPRVEPQHISLTCCVRRQVLSSPEWPCCSW